VKEFFDLPSWLQEMHAEGEAKGWAISILQILLLRYPDLVVSGQMRIQGVNAVEQLKPIHAALILANGRAAGGEHATQHEGRMEGEARALRNSIEMFLLIHFAEVIPICRDILQSVHSLSKLRKVQESIFKVTEANSVKYILHSLQGEFILEVQK
jgi:hypothetical protein